MTIALKPGIVFPSEDFTDKSMFSAPQLEAVNAEISRYREIS